MPNQPSDLKSFLEAVNNNKFVILDTETTSIDDRGEVVSIAIINQHGNTLLNTLVKPTCPISPIATKITGITNEWVKNAPPWSQVRLNLLDVLHGVVVVAYNATFDRRIIHQSDRAHGIPDTDWQGAAPWYCAMEAFAERFGEWNDYRGNYKWQKLITAVEFYGLQDRGAHGALNDSLMTLDVVKAMMHDPMCISLEIDDVDLGLSS